MKYVSNNGEIHVNLSNLKLVQTRVNVLNTWKRIYGIHVSIFQCIQNSLQWPKQRKTLTVFARNE